MDPKSSSTVPLHRSTTASTSLTKRKRRFSTSSLDPRPAKYGKSPTPRPGPEHASDQFATSQLTLSFTRNDATSDFIGIEPGDTQGLPHVPSGEYHDSLPLSVKSLFADKQLTVTRAGRRAWFTKERVAIKLLEEIEIFREAVRSETEETRSLPYKAQQALALADATRETLRAERDLVTQNVAVIKLRLKAEEEKLEEIVGRLNTAELQHGALSFSLRAHKLGRDWVQSPHDIYHFKPQTRYQERWPYPGAMENESGSPSSIESIDNLDSDTSDHMHDNGDV